MRSWLIAAAVVVVVACAGCKDKGTAKAKAVEAGSNAASGSAGSGSGSGSQSYADAINVLCGHGAQPPDVSTLGPDDRHTVLNTWLDTTIKDPKARALLATFGETPDRAAAIRSAAGEAAIADCKPLDMFKPRTVGGVSVPELASEIGTEVLDQELPVIAVSPTGVVVDGLAIVQVKDGAIAAADADTLAAHMKQAAAHHTEAGGTFNRVVVAIDPSLAVTMLGTIAKAVIAAGAKRVDLAVLVGKELRVVPVAYPAPAPMPKAKPPGPPPVQMIISITADKLVVASLSGQEGTVQVPKAEVALAPLAAAGTALQTALGAIVKQRWSAATRDPADQQIVVLAAPATRLATFAQVAAWVRAAADGTPLFPEVASSTRFE